MHVAPRSYLTAGIAVLGAGAIAIAPVQPVPDHLSAAPQHAVESLAVNLAAAIDPFTPIVNTIETSFANIKTIFEQQAQTGLFPILSSMASNTSIYLNDLPDVAKIFQQQLGNVKAAVAAPLDQNLEGDPFDPTFPEISYNNSNTQITTCLGGTPCGNNGFTKLQTLGLMGAFDQTKPLVPAFNLLSSPLAGAILGFAGPGLSAFVQLQDSIKVINEAIAAQNFAVAINEVINLPVNLINASLNGGKHLDLTDIVDKYASELGFTLPEGSKIGVELGGFLTPGVALGGTAPNTQPDEKNPPFIGWGGTAFDAVTLNATIAGFNVDVGGLPVGTLATGLGLRYAVASAIKLPVPPPPAAQAKIAPAASTPAVPATPAAPASPATPPELATESTPVVVEDVADEPAPVVVAEVEEAAPADLDVAEIEAAVAEVEAEVAEAEAPAAAEDNAPAAATGSDDSGDTGSRATDSRRGAASED